MSSLPSSTPDDCRFCSARSGAFLEPYGHMAAVLRSIATSAIRARPPRTSSRATTGQTQLRRALAHPAAATMSARYRVGHGFTCARQELRPGRASDLTVVNVLSTPPQRGRDRAMGSDRPRAPRPATIPTPAPFDLHSDGAMDLAATTSLACRPPDSTRYGLRALVQLLARARYGLSRVATATPTIITRGGHERAIERRQGSATPSQAERQPGTPDPGGELNALGRDEAGC